MNLQSSVMGETSIARSQADFMSKVYAWMFGGLLTTALTAWYVWSSGLFINIIQSGMMFPLIIVEFVLVFAISAKIQSMSKIVAGSLFLAYSFLNGLTLTVILAKYTLESVQDVFFITSAMFAALSAFGYFTKKNLSAMGSFMYMGLFGLIFIGIFNIFLQSSAWSFAYSLIGVIIFAGLTAWDTQKLKEMHELQYQGDEMAVKGAIIGALMLYLDFINLFIFLMRFLGKRN